MSVVHNFWLYLEPFFPARLLRSRRSPIQKGVTRHHDQRSGYQEGYGESYSLNDKRPVPQAVVDARARLIGAKAAAVEAEAGRRLADLQAVAAELTPVLEQLGQLEVRRTDAARDAVAGELDAIGRPVEVRLSSRLSWPRSVADDNKVCSLTMARNLASSGTALLGEHARRFGVAGGHERRTLSE